MVEDWRGGLMRQVRLQASVVDMGLDGCARETADRLLGCVGRNIEREVTLLLFRLVGIEAQVAIAEPVAHHEIDGMLLRSGRQPDYQRNIKDVMLH
jgi:hypothetical protein